MGKKKLTPAQLHILKLMAEGWELKDPTDCIGQPYLSAPTDGRWPMRLIQRQRAATIKKLASLGLIDKPTGGPWQLTPAGKEER